MPLNWRKLAREKSAGGYRRPLHFMNVEEMREMRCSIKCSRDNSRHSLAFCPESARLPTLKVALQRTRAPELAHPTG
jgi:hypothetical protein